MDWREREVQGLIDWMNNIEKDLDRLERDKKLMENTGIFSSNDLKKQLMALEHLASDLETINRQIPKLRLSMHSAHNSPIFGKVSCLKDRKHTDRLNSKMNKLVKGYWVLLKSMESSPAHDKKEKDVLTMILGDTSGNDVKTSKPDVTSEFDYYISGIMIAIQLLILLAKKLKQNRDED